VPVGYSGTPLPKKLGIRATMRLAVLGSERAGLDYAALLGALPDGVQIGSAAGRDTELVHLFVTRRDLLEQQLGTLRGTLADSAVVWVSWPKQAAKVPTNVTEDVIRELALPLGFVDVKVCAVSAVWSGLKLVVRKALRSGHGA